MISALIPKMRRRVTLPSLCAQLIFCQIVDYQVKKLIEDYATQAVISLIYTLCDLGEYVDTNLKSVLSIRLP